MLNHACCQLASDQTPAFGRTKKLASFGDALIKRYLLVKLLLAKYPQPDGKRKCTLVSGSIVKMNAVLPLETEPGGAWDPEHRGVVFSGEALMTRSVLLHSKTNTICKKCAQNVKLYGTVSEWGSFSASFSFHLSCLYPAESQSSLWAGSVVIAWLIIICRSLFPFLLV